MAERKGPMECKMQTLNNSHSLTLTKNNLHVNNNSNYNYNTARCNVGIKGGGKWYYEVTLNSNSQMLIGWCTEQFVMAPDSYQGVGYDAESWAFDGYNSYRYHAGKGEVFGSNYYATGDVFGMGLDLDAKKMLVWKNGNLLGDMFENIPQSKFLYPAISLKRYQQVEFNFGKTPFKYAQNDYLPLHSFLTDNQKKELEKLFEKYKQDGISLSESQENYGDFIKSDGVFKLAKDIGSSGDTDPILMVVAWKLTCARPWEIDRKEWMTLALYGVHDIKKLTSEAAKWKQEAFSDDKKLKPFYCFCFDYLREERKNLTIDECKLLWKILAFDNKKWPLWNDWLAFLESKGHKQIAKDEWTQLFNFMIKYPKGLDNFENQDPWPVLIDSFVEYVETGGADDDSDEMDL